MKKTMALVILVTALTALAVSAVASTQLVLRADISFPFYLETQLLQAGTYEFELGAMGTGTASSVLVRQLDGKGVALLFTTPTLYRSVKAGQLRFHRYGEKYFMTSIETRGHAACLRTSRIEKELIAQFGMGRIVTLIAQR